MGSQNLNHWAAERKSPAPNNQGESILDVDNFIELGKNVLVGTRLQRGLE